MGNANKLTLYAAGSLRDALTDVARAYEAAHGNRIEATFGASGLLKDEIASGAKVDVFASANMDHPHALHLAGKSNPVIRFTRNKLCALVRPGLPVNAESLLTHMLDVDIKLGTSTPKTDPSGDYAFKVFAKAEAIEPGARAALEVKALKLTGAKDSVMPPDGRSIYAWHILEGRADIFLTYCTNAIAAKRENRDLQIVNVPPELAVSAHYGLAVRNGAGSAAQDFAQFILSPEGQNILVSHGFSPNP